MNDFDSLLKTAAAQYQPSKAVFARVKNNIMRRKSAVTVVFFSESFGEIMDKIYRENQKKQEKFLRVLERKQLITRHK